MPFNGDRLRILRRFNELSQRDLGEQIGSPASTITGYERGRTTPKGLALDALCAALKVEADFLFDLTSDDEFHEPETNFRSLTKTPDHLRKKVLSHATLFGVVLRHLTTEIFLPEFRVPKIAASTLSDIEDAAERVRVELGAGADAPIDNTTNMVEHAGVVVTVLDKKIAKDVDAFSRYGATNVMVLNPAKASATRARFDILHELAHGTLHRTGIPMDHAVKEDQADYFAGAALLPKRSFAREFWGLGRRRDWEGFFDLKAKWGASVVAIVVRAYQLGLMDAAEYRRRCKDMSKRGWFRSPEPAERDAEKPELFHIVLRRFQEETGKTITSIVADLKWTPALWTDVTGVSPPSPEGPTVTSFEEFRQRRLTLEQ